MLMMPDGDKGTRLVVQIAVLLQQLAVALLHVVHQHLGLLVVFLLGFKGVHTSLHLHHLGLQLLDALVRYQ